MTRKSISYMPWNVNIHDQVYENACEKYGL